MVDETELVQLFRLIVGDVCPDELDTFDIEGPTLITEELSEKASHPFVEGDVQSRFGFQLDPTVVANFGLYVKLIAGTFEAIRALGWLRPPGRLSSEQLSQLETRWQEDLQRQRIPAQRAALIVSRFSKDLVETLSKK
jgi:hypothetical protein